MKEIQEFLKEQARRMSTFIVATWATFGGAILLDITPVAMTIIQLFLFLGMLIFALFRNVFMALVLGGMVYAMGATTMEFVSYSTIILLSTIILVCAVGTLLSERRHWSVFWFHAFAMVFGALSPLLAPDHVTAAMFFAAVGVITPHALARKPEWFAKRA